MNEFDKQGFVICQNFADVTGLFDYTKSIMANGMINDAQTPGAPSFYKDLEMNKLQIRCMNKMEEQTGLKLYPTYNYFRIYNSKSILYPHRDRPACEISVTLNVGYTGEYNWPIWIQGNDGENYEVTLRPGDAVIYKGCENLHWRQDADIRVKCQSQVFMHYVNQDGPYANCIYDEIRL